MVQAVRKIVLALVLVMSLVGCSCSGDSNEGRKRITVDDLYRYDRMLFMQDSLFLCYYSDSLGLNPKPLDNNLWLTIHKEGAGPQIQVGQSVSYAFVVMSVLGDTLYSSAEEGVRTITVGRAEDIVGMDEVLPLLRVGAQATVLFIPEKAFGVVGDHRKIHGRTPVRYDITVLQ